MTRIDGRGWTLYRGDCLDVMRVLERVDLVLTDPPYSPHVHSKSRQGASLPDAAEFACRFHRATEFGFDAIEPWQVGLAAAHFARLARRWVVAFSDFELAPVWRAKAARFGLEYIRTGAWWKVGGTPQFSGDRPAVALEALTICHPRGRKSWNGGGRAASWEHPEEDPGDALPSVFRHATNESEIVLDAYMGVATTGVAALRRGRRFIGIERDPRWFDLAVQRLRAEELGSSLQASRAGQVALFGGTQ